MLRSAELWVARALSGAFQPLFIPLYSLLVLFNSDTHITYGLGPEVRYFIYGVVGVNTILLPMAVFYYLLAKGYISSFHMPDGAERTLPFLTVIVFQASTWWLFRTAAVPPLLADLVLGSVVSVIAALLINFYWKISIHMLGMGGLVGTYLGLSLRFGLDMNPLLMALILLSGLVGFARLRVHAHTPAQVYAGFVLGTLIFVAVVGLA